MKARSPSAETVRFIATILAARQTPIAEVGTTITVLHNALMQLTAPTAPTAPVERPVFVTRAPATVAVKPAAASIFRGTSLAVSVTVAGKSGTPAGTVQLTGGGFTSAAKSLTSGKVTFTIPSSVLKAGVDVLTATYSGSVQFNTAVGTAKVTVTLLTPTVTVTPAALTASRAKSLLVSIRVGASTGTPTGTVTLASGSYKSAAATLVSGKAKITIPADALHAGKDVVTATYTGVGNYKSASGEVKITVTE